MSTFVILLDGYWQASQSGLSIEHASGALDSSSDRAAALELIEETVPAADDTAFSVPRSTVDFSVLVALRARR
jgi:hypothetical protein